MRNIAKRCEPPTVIPAKIAMPRFTAGLHVPKTDDENAFQEAKRKA